MRALMMLGAISCAAILGSVSSARAETIRVIAADSESLVALVGAPPRRVGTSVTARIISAHRWGPGLTDYSIDLMEYDCVWMKERSLEYRKFDTSGTLIQSYNSTEWRGLYTTGRHDVMRNYLCSGSGQPVVVEAPSAGEFARRYLRGEWTVP